MSDCDSDSRGGVKPYRCSTRFEKVVFTRGNEAWIEPEDEKGLINFRPRIWSIDRASWPWFCIPKWWKWPRNWKIRQPRRRQIASGHRRRSNSSHNYRPLRIIANVSLTLELVSSQRAMDFERWLLNENNNPLGTGFPFHPNHSFLAFQTFSTPVSSRSARSSGSVHQSVRSSSSTALSRLTYVNTTGREGAERFVSHTD